MILGLSLVHGGPGGNFLSKNLFNAIAFGIGTKDADIEDLHGNEFENINKVLHLFYLGIAIGKYFIRNKFGTTMSRQLNIFFLIFR